MKLIIDIPELDYECAKQRWMRGNDAHKMDYYISKGTPLDDVKAEIDEQYDRVHPYNIDVAQGLEMALEILNNIGKESED